ncbi:tRNA (adenosine(37)-N6)-threonylcarbamoyltransferase complex ATPase subunit type 1 TsaE [Acidiluteibacter ferrifornacis]|uniref:tRNA threonylcarbamoyladenosine biosynthesis protein TsaE n=1 Tax=Acidiluteibacter ferrifornacis TaxID=2692424 RepID=A0A6N9NNS2_9FLAO|nr:tRNA (adenosine(37)-N6)-threonylcarbamoyltransferase complex ATPase subunit type 1 TsaE [Acidiluteibacter ferrifornacis]NBG66747.1 tRNA (adenosine(37)-N6)-threonylcarbamoyltransferase complex ATPase subunit type 1 TsaE [Acidiluteibacter ferrifornacis]
MMLKASSLAELDEIAKRIIDCSKEKKVILFYGEMGAGKTTLIKIICKLLKVEDLTSSPTFSLVNEYYSPLLEESVYHFDFYRVDEEEEAMDMGVEDYFYSDSYCLVEWPEKIPNLLPESYVTVRVEQKAEERIYTIQ